MYKLFKRLFDIICALLGLIVSSPFWLLAVIGIEISDPGPVFYMANRVGKDNKIFKMFKFRSMRQGKANESVFRGDEDRIFSFGKFIRATKIDELPQLLNILFGNMSIVGPRPAAVDQLSIVRAGKYGIASTVTAGLTGPSALYDYIYGDTVEDAKRAHHFYHENERVRKGIEAWRKGDIKTFGEQIFRSGRSSIYYYEAGSEPLKALYDIMLKTDGIYGGRFSGAGFNGCCMAIVDPEKIDSIKEYITTEYAKVFPEYMKDFVIEICDTADGVEL